MNSIWNHGTSAKSSPRAYTRWLAMTLCVVMVMQLAACGTLIHPERRGQDGGRIDPAIAILDGIGLLLFIIPGLIAYAVDFSTGAIYLPGSDTSMAPGDGAPGDGTKDMAQKVVYVDPDELDAETIERVIKEHTGMTVDVDDARAEAYRYDGASLMLREMAKVNGEILASRTMARAAH